MKINITLHETRAQDAIARLIKSGSDMSPLMRDIGEKLLTRTRDRFADERDPNNKRWAELVRLGRSWSGFGWGWAGLGGVGRGWTELVGAGQGWAGLVRLGRGWSGLVGVGRGWSGLVGVGRGWSRLGNTSIRTAGYVEAYNLKNPRYIVLEGEVDE